ncbi:MAG TPA: ABC transporter ATP-binding protein [Arcobacter sp.]|nr:ABC transporter ATP-binding protein [Arcobacter sp.]HIP56160.1 ABC transporter ATP-binding protein [Arcobacter sp.]
MILKIYYKDTKKMIQVNNFSNYILKDISLEIKEKNLIIIGSNGAGKTTLAKLIAGLIPTQNIKINNINPSNIFTKSKTSLINYIPSSMDIFDEYISVYEYLKLSNLHTSKNIDEVLEYLDILFLKDQLCKNLSSGQAQLVLCASSILHNALYTIFDEPTSNLDPSKVKNIFKLLKDEINLQHKIIITHDLNLAYKLQYDILFLDDGKIIFQGSNDKFFDEKNLENIFQNSVKKVQNNIVVDFV